MQKTELGFYLIADSEYYNLQHPEKDTVYVLVNSTDDEYLVLKNGQFMGKIDKYLKDMKMTPKAVHRVEEQKKEIVGLKPQSKIKVPGTLTYTNSQSLGLTPIKKEMVAEKIKEP